LSRFELNLKQVSEYHRIPPQERLRVIKNWLNQPVSWLKNISRIKGFAQWAQYCLADIEQANLRLDKNQPQKALEIIRRLKEAVRLKYGQFRLNELLLKTGFDLINGENHWSMHQTSIASIGEYISSVDETGFVEPVCRKILEHLAIGDIFLNQAPRPKAITQAREALRQALALF